MDQNRAAPVKLTRPLMGPVIFELVLWLFVIVFYHVSEVILVVLFNPDELGWDSTLITWPYLGAISIGLIEFGLEWYFLPDIKQMLARPCLLLGLVIAITGDCFRKAAIMTAGASFTHLIKEERRDQHVMITHGIYSWCRHPGYLGWFWWSIGSQIMLANPFSVPLFGFLAWKFFRGRIPYEEYYLEQMFGEDYAVYKYNTPTRIPFIP